jgi:excisionase family DNA binding protein
MKQDSLVRLRRLRRERGGKRWNFRELSFSVGEAAQLLGVSNGTIRRWDREGKFHCFRTAGGQRRIPESQVECLRSLRKNDFSDLPKQPSRVKSPMRHIHDFVSGLAGKLKGNTENPVKTS